MDPSVLLLSITSDNPAKNPKGRSEERPLGFWKDLTFVRPTALFYRNVSTISTTADTLSTRPIMRVSRVTPRMLIA